MRTKTSRTLTAALAALALAGAAAGCSKDTTTTSATTVPATSPATNPAAGVTISNAWARTSPAGVTSGAAYATLVSAVDDELVKAEVPTSVAAETQLHETVTGSETGTTMAGSGTTTGSSDHDKAGIRAHDEGGTTTTTTAGTGTTMGGPDEMSMREVSHIDLPAGQKVEFKPGGYHIMLMDLAAPLKAGQTIEVTLTFEKAGTQKVTATVRDN